MQSVHMAFYLDIFNDFAGAEISCLPSRKDGPIGAPKSAPPSSAGHTLRYNITNLWRRAQRRRSQKHSMTWPLIPI